MRELEIAQRFAALNEKADACAAYKMALERNNGEDPDIDMEAAAYILQYGSGEDYKISYTIFRDLYNRGIMKNSILSIMSTAFYEPNVKLLKSHYEKNCKLLEKYPYIFRKDFPNFEELPIHFFPFDDKGYTPFYADEERFGEYINPKNEVIAHNFFKDLDKPVLGKDIFSQYELEYLKDNVRKSEFIGRENHIYLHYSDWKEFCSYMQILNFKQLLAEQKFVILIADEISKYPIDFKERYGIDYGKHPVKPVGIREVNKIIWHTQLASHNGGDFFNEIFDSHPNLLAMPSLMMSNVEETVSNIQKALKEIKDRRELPYVFQEWENLRRVEELYSMHDRTDKDVLVAIFFREMDKSGMKCDESSRIAPAIFFQPHFYNILYRVKIDEQRNRAILVSDQYEKVRTSSLFRGFKYIKTFTPMRRITTSYAATVKFMAAQGIIHEGDDKVHVFGDEIFVRLFNRSYMIDWQDRLFKDSVLVRFEDGKLNPKATFTALAAFLDLPYTDSMTRCTDNGKDAYTKGNVVGFDPATVYRTYDEFTNNAERCFLEYFLKDVYEYYGYNFNYYDGRELNLSDTIKMLDEFIVLDSYIRDSWQIFFNKEADLFEKDPDIHLKVIDNNNLEIESDQKTLDKLKDELVHTELSPGKMLEEYMENLKSRRLHNVKCLFKEPVFYNRNGQQLHMMTKLELDPNLLDQPLYH